MEKVIIFGLGELFFFRLYYLRKDYEIVAVTDNNEAAKAWWRDCCEYGGEKIITPVEIGCFSEDIKIIIAAGKNSSRRAIKMQLLLYGVKECRIIELNEKKQGKFVLDPLFFKPVLTEKEMQSLFSDNCESVSIEVNSACNRKCWFCPNSILDRHSENNKMSIELFGKIIKELKEIDYSEIITYSFYNEPLLDKDLETKIQYVKSNLPLCKQLISTNGDYLSANRLQSLVDAGLDYLIISVYGKNDYTIEWDGKVAEEEIKSIVSQTGINISYKRASTIVVEWFGKKDNCYIRLQNYDFKKVAHNRGEILPETLPLKQVKSRSEVCANSFVTFNIFYNGIVTVCGNMREDYERHSEFMIGDINKNSIFEIFASEKARNFRKGFINDINRFPCSTCSRVGGVYDTFIPVYPGAPLLSRPRYEKIKMEKP